MRMKWWTCLAPRSSTIVTPPRWWFCLSRWCGMSTRWWWWSSSSADASSIMAKIMVPCSTSSVDWVIIGHTICRPSCQNTGRRRRHHHHRICSCFFAVSLIMYSTWRCSSWSRSFGVLFDPDNLFLMKSYSLWGLSCACCCYIRWVSTAHIGLNMEKLCNEKCEWLHHD